MVHAPDSPVRLDRARMLVGGDEAPPVLLYAATNLKSEPLEQFTVTVFVFDQEGRLKARHAAPGRRTLEANATKFSAMVLDGAPIEATDRLVVGVDQAQYAGSESWWRGNIRPAAEDAIKRQPQ